MHGELFFYGYQSNNRTSNTTRQDFFIIPIIQFVQNRKAIMCIRVVNIFIEILLVEQVRSRLWVLLFRFEKI